MNFLMKEILSQFKATSHYPLQYGASKEITHVVDLVESVLSDKKLQEILKKKNDAQQRIETEVEIFEKQMKKNFETCMSSIKVH